jgi:predicted RNA-binding Zn-ribbon protein involved in translation (DUF1610 family)
MKPLTNINELLHTLKHRKPTQIYCPRCASPKIHLSSSFDTWLFPTKYRCENCGYVGPIVMELEKEENQKKKETPNQATPNQAASSKSYTDSEP